MLEQNEPLDKLPPHSIEAEEALLGSLIIDGDAIFRVIDVLTPQAFYREKNGWVYEACCALCERGEAIDQVTVSHEMSKTEKGEAIGGPAYLSYLVSMVPTSVHAEYYAKVVVNTHRQRRLMQAGYESAMKAMEAKDGSVDECIADAIGSLIELQRDGGGRGVVSPRMRAEFALTYYWRLADREQTVSALFGLPCLDRLGGMAPGEYIIIGGETEAGKTTLLSQIARNVATTGNVLFVSGEMSLVQTANRDVARLTGRYIRQISRGEYSEELMRQIVAAVAVMSAEQVYYYIKGGLTVPMVYAVARSLQAEHGLKLLVVDYLQRLQDSRHGKTSYERASNISEQLKDMAENLDIPVLVASQLSRGVGKPTVARLRDTGRIEEDADFVILLHRNKNNCSDEATLIVAKHRQGGEHLEQKLIFDWRSQTYSEVEG